MGVIIINTMRLFDVICNCEMDEEYLAIVRIARGSGEGMIGKRPHI